ncbi:XRE family transcriptional regulator [uncultured Treponema sp.]|mgnify:FL=1|jgi:predicted XRE-type DNA-binding protein|uniref:XRE family transcriptional regulator n=1 Tax=uncultured Treponema sp. TaxID=162155 RepID=UPI0020635C62|nr:XRE family transcriptional regulator [uncultured Treponema sp.]DAG30115.1 MAG TPA: helix-turn-helix domain protein [Caudoviricetes sp.]
MNGIGQDFSDFMKEQGLYEEAQELATKKVIAAQLQAEMEKQKLSKSAVAQRMNTTRTAVDNALNPAFNTSLSTIERFARALGKRVSVVLV